MTIFNSILATVRFEISRVMSVQRIGVAVVMALFPPVMVLILQSTDVMPFPEFLISILCGMICLLSLLLWATSNVYSELEGKSWTFITSRPYGRWSILFGKYLLSFIWSFLISWAALTLCICALVLGGGPPEQSGNFLDAATARTITTVDQDGKTVEVNLEGGLFSSEFREVPSTDAASGSGAPATVFMTGESYFTVWFYLSIMLFLSSMVYSAIFSFLGVLIQRRAMVFAVGYFLIVEIVCALIPAIIGKFAMSYHMLSVLTQWLGWIGPDDEFGKQFQLVWGYYPPWVHLGAIFAVTFLMLGMSAYIIRSREYLTLEDAQI